MLTLFRNDWLEVTEDKWGHYAQHLPTFRRVTIDQKIIFHANKCEKEINSSGFASGSPEASAIYGMAGVVALLPDHNFSKIFMSAEPKEAVKQSIYWLKEINASEIPSHNPDIIDRLINPDILERIIKDSFPAIVAGCVGLGILIIWPKWIWRHSEVAQTSIILIIYAILMVAASASGETRALGYKSRWWHVLVLTILGIIFGEIKS